MNGPLAVFSAQIGTVSETFVRRHMEDLLPGRTVVVANRPPPPFGGHWAINAPALMLNEMGLFGRLPRFLRPFLQKELIRQFLKTHGVKVILGEYLDLCLPWLSVARSSGIPFFAHAHGYDVSVRLRDQRWRNKYLQLESATGLITVSEHSRERLVKLGLSPDKIHVIPCGTEVAPELPKRTDDGSAIRCLAVGRMVTKKGPLLMLDAFRRALERVPNLHLDYLGDGELRAPAERFVHEFQIGSKVTFHGSCPTSTVADYMRRADIFVQHSMLSANDGDEEGLPVSILEAMAHGLPVVSTRHAGIPEAVTNGETGFLVAEGENITMAERIVLLARNPGLRRRMGAAGWARARMDFSWQKEKASLLRLLGLDTSDPRNKE